MTTFITPLKGQAYNSWMNNTDSFTLKMYPLLWTRIPTAIINRNHVVKKQYKKQSYMLYNMVILCLWKDTFLSLTKQDIEM